MEDYECYCPRCKTRQPIVDKEEKIGKKGEIVVKGRCKGCGEILIKIEGDCFKKKESLSYWR